jgi:hypothetical protein
MKTASKTYAARLTELLAPLAAKCETWPLHWVGNGDEGESYCRDCCEKEVARLEAENPEGDYFVDGGWGGEEDGCAFCSNDECGRLLECSYTNYGVESELEHFAGPDTEVTTPQSAYLMTRVLEHISGCNGDYEFGPKGCEATIRDIYRRARRALKESR